MAMSTATPPETLTIRSSTDELAQVDDLTERIARDMGFDDSAIGDVAISVTEAVNNAIIHAHHYDEQKNIVIHFEPQPAGLQIRVLDQGEGFDSEALADPTLPENIYKDTGRGIHVIRHLMDKLEIHSRETGTEVVMLKLKAKRAS
jgi:serine/threonine-protein kinase RsbW